MNPLPVWRGVTEGLPEVSWEAAGTPSTALRLTEILQVLNEAFDRLAAGADTPLTSEAA
jgi:hypothetical protein